MNYEQNIRYLKGRR